MKPVAKLTRIPQAFSDIGRKVNELTDAVNAARNVKGGTGITATVTDTDVTIETAAGASGKALPAGVTFEEFTICDSGTPATRWIPTWTSDPS